MAALTGIRVLDLSRLLPGPFATQLLVDAGADVVKVEDPNGGDYLRHMPPLLADGTSALFHAINRGKRSVALDLKDTAHRAQFLALVDRADVVVESFRPGVLARLDLAPEALRARNPRLIVCSITGFGATGARAHRAGHDVSFLAVAGALGLMKSPGLVPLQVADLAGGALPAALGIMTALFARTRTGLGTHVTIDMTQATASLLSTTLARTAAGEGVDNVLTHGAPCYGVYATKDGHIAVGALEPKFWFGLCDAIERPDLRDAAFDDRAREALASIFASKTNAQWSAVFATRDVCVEIVRSADEVLADEAVVTTVSVDVDGKSVRIPVPNFALPGATPSTKAAPKLGEHDANIWP